jgi:hypothetical protein
MYTLKTFIADKEVLDSVNSLPQILFFTVRGKTFPAKEGLEK